jgi:hypothetical protein
MALGYTQLVTAVQEKYTSGAPDISYAMAEKDVLDTCSGMFKHPHLSDTFVRNLKLSGLDKQTIRAWKAARHFSKLSAFTAKQLLTVEKFEDQLNLSACHLSLGSRRVHLARTLLKSVADDGEKVGLYTRLPERIDGLEQACVLIGVSCLSVQNQTLTTDSPIVRLLQLDKMGVADITVLHVAADEEFSLETENGQLMALVCPGAISEEGALHWTHFSQYHVSHPGPWCLGCEAEPSPNIERTVATLKQPEGAAGFRVVQGFKVHAVGPRSGVLGNKCELTNGILTSRARLVQQ